MHTWKQILVAVGPLGHDKEGNAEMKAERPVRRL